MPSSMEAKRCADCGKGTVKPDRPACKQCGSTLWVDDERAQTELKLFAHRTVRGLVAAVVGAPNTSEVSRGTRPAGGQTAYGILEGP